ncbi:hypothetical protein BC827DRAFT_1271175 [Russula dissimulans]|nr:hypothetical protein BC827DRAFT_1271175 [Russula dissimulans]
MSVHPSLRSLFETALNEFESRTGINLVQHQVFKASTGSYPANLSKNDNALMKWIKPTVHVLHALSTNHIVVSGVSSAFPPAMAVFAGIAILLSVSDKGYDSLVDLFESFQSSLRRLDIYTKIPSTIAITEVIVKILAELLSTICLAIQQAKQGRLSKL